MLFKVITERDMLLNKGRGCHIKKYFRFTYFRKNKIQFTLWMMLWIVCQYFDTPPVSVKRMILTGLIFAAIFIIESLIIDWVQMRNKSSENGETEERGL